MRDPNECFSPEPCSHCKRVNNVERLIRELAGKPCTETELRILVSVACSG